MHAGADRIELYCLRTLVTEKLDLSRSPVTNPLLPGKQKSLIGASSRTSSVSSHLVPGTSANTIALAYSQPLLPVLQRSLDNGNTYSSNWRARV